MSAKPTYEELAQRVRELEKAESERKQTETTNEYKYRLLFLFLKHSPIYAFLKEISNNVSKVLYASDNYIDMVGMPASQMIGKTMDELFPQEFAEKITQDDIDVVSKGKNLKLDEELNGRHYVTYKFPITFDDKKYLAGYTIDVTDRKRAEEDFAQIFAMSLDMICIADIKTATFIKVNPAFTEILGFSEDELLQRSFMEFVHPDDIESTRFVIEKKLQEGIRVINFENRYRCKDGRYRWLSWVAHPDPEKKITFSIARDITDRKALEIEQIKTQQELLKRNKFIETILDNLPIGLGFNDIDSGKVTYLNTKWEEIYGWPKEAFPTVAHFFEKVFPDPRIREILKEKIMNDIASGDPNRMAWDDLEITTSNGEKRIIYGKNIPLMDENVMISTVQDFTEKHKLQAQIQQSQKMKAIGTLAGGIAHDFNNMLSILIGNISYALSILNKDNELFDVLSDVMLGTKQAQNLTHQLLTFAKGGEPIKTSCNVNKLLEESAKFVTSGARSKCNFKLAGNLWTAEVDPGQLNQVISNLVINADQAMPDGGIITVQTKNIKIETNSNFQLPAGQYIKISIEDQGIGIHKKHISNIFDPYFTTKHKGSGLGLATTYSIIKKHGGHITAYSEVGKGTVFDIYLPASLKVLAETENKEKSQHQGQGRILIMDDQEPILKMVGRMLNRMGYESTFAIDGSEAIEKYREAYQNRNPFDIVILDLTVPGGMGGTKTIPELIKIDPNVKAVVSSGYSNDPIMANYKDYGFCGVVPKPYTKDQMSNLLNKILGENE